MKFRIKSVAAAVAVALSIAVVSAPSKADLVCPKGSLGDFAPSFIWDRYKSASAAYLAQLHQRLSVDLKAVLAARGVSAQVRAAQRLGLTRAMVMERMFEQGFIAATDIVNARCVMAPATSPWSASIKRQREAAWCRQWGTAHFCPR